MNLTYVPSSFIRNPFFNILFSILSFIFSYSNCSSLAKFFLEEYFVNGFPGFLFGVNPSIPFFRYDFIQLLIIPLLNPVSFVMLQVLLFISNTGLIILYFSSAVHCLNF